MKVALCFSSESTRSSLGVDSVAIAVDMVVDDGIVGDELTEARDRILKSRHVALCLKRLHAVSNCSILSHMSPNSYP